MTALLALAVHLNRPDFLELVISARDTDPLIHRLIPKLGRCFDEGYLCSPPASDAPRSLNPNCSLIGQVPSGEAGFIQAMGDREACSLCRLTAHGSVVLLLGEDDDQYPQGDGIEYFQFGKAWYGAVERPTRKALKTLFLQSILYTNKVAVIVDEVRDSPEELALATRAILIEAFDDEALIICPVD